MKRYDTFIWRLLEHAIFAFSFYFAIQGHIGAIVATFLCRLMQHEVHIANTVGHTNAINKNADALKLLYDKVEELERKLQ